MNEPKPFASLGPTLLARKGGARPAMRPQLASVGIGNGAKSATALAQDFDELEDLGWNDMGEDDTPDRPADVLQLTPAPHNPESEAKTDAGSPKALVRSIHEELAEMLERGEPEHAIPRAKPVKPAAAAVPPVAPVPTRNPEPVLDAAQVSPGDKALRRAAFTLRLDAKRHLKLRLASTVRNRSAQQLVTEALDRFLKDIPEVELLARNIQHNGRKGG